MNSKIIEKAGRDVIIVAFKSRDFAKANRMSSAEVFTAVASGSTPVAWYNTPPVKTRSGAVPIMRYALHRPTKKNGILQLSCMEIRNGQTIPTSDLQFGDFFRELPNYVKIFIK